MFQNLPEAIVQKILIMRPTHPLAIIFTDSDAYYEWRMDIHTLRECNDDKIDEDAELPFNMYWSRNFSSAYHELLFYSDDYDPSGDVDILEQFC